MDEHDKAWKYAFQLMKKEMLDSWKGALEKDEKPDSEGTPSKGRSEGGK